MKAAERVASAAGPEGFPRGGLPEIALLGRSNVGKSSLLNRLAGRQRLAFASSKPGTTRLLHFYEVQRGGRPLLLVDLPGYGWARVSKREREAWRALAEGYLGGRPPLRAALLLQDLRRDVTSDELELIDWLAERGVPVLVVLTKSDKLAASARRVRSASLTTAYGLPATRVIPTSARTGDGLPALWQAIERLLEDAGDGVNESTKSPRGWK